VSNPCDRMSKARVHWLFAVIALGVTACAQVSGDADGVVIEHAANQVGAADYQAQDHCQKHGRNAVRVKTGSARTSALLLQSRVSTYRCVQP